MIRFLISSSVSCETGRNLAGAVSERQGVKCFYYNRNAPLHQADILLTRARLFFCTDRAAARADLTHARTLIGRHGYGRRTQELHDAEAAIGVKSDGCSEIARHAAGRIGWWRRRQP